jgi:hypothetical protein
MSIRLSSGVSLIEWPQGSASPWAEYNGQIFGAGETLPLATSPFARDFVAHYMSRKYGLPIYWPPLAIEFVFPIAEDRKSFRPEPEGH